MRTVAYLLALALPVADVESAKEITMHKSFREQVRAINQLIDFQRMPKAEADAIRAERLEMKRERERLLEQYAEQSWADLMARFESGKKG